MWRVARFLSFDATPIFYRTLRETPDLKGVVVIVHGMGEHGGRYQALGEYLGKLGFLVVIPDLRGFGKSGGRRAFVRAFDEYRQDLKAVCDFVLRQHKNLPLFMLGHSFGGLIAASFVATHTSMPICGLVLSSPNFGICLPIAKWRHFLAMALSYLAPTFYQETMILPEYLTHDQSVVDEMKRDPLMFRKISMRLYGELTLMLHEANGDMPHKIKCPCLVLQAGADKIVSLESTERFYASLASKDKEIEIYPKYFHEILNEPKRMEIFARIGRWLSEKV